MNTYDDLVNDYLRAVEQALAGVPANRRAELLADLSEHIAAKRAELSPDRETEVEVRSILELLGDPEEVAAEALVDAESPPPILIQPKKRSTALIWVALTIAAVATMCVVAGLLGMVLFWSSSSVSSDGTVTQPEVTVVTGPPMSDPATPTLSTPPTPTHS
ncbi:HAAS signaling domain-containing protein [Dactylosporangium sp. NPDC048998]|uniref:HAAS signaling domain-containing protein n=1 Tax=Dactylosporangium sp. NPDC048998 TaxID=3363976 RepID=UPI00372321DA